MSLAPGFYRCRLFLFLLLGFLIAIPQVEARTRRRSRASSPASSSRSSVTRPTVPAASSFEAWGAAAANAERNLGESWGAVIEDLDSTATLFEYRGQRRLVPASNRKIVTFGLALENLGPTYQFQTEFGLSVPCEPGQSHLHGDVILRSSGDPSLTDPFMKNGRNPADIFKTWARTLKDTGITTIYGNLVIDGSAFGDSQNDYPDEIWGPNHKNQTYAPIPSALAMCQNLMRITVQAGSALGRPGSIDIFPADEGISVINNTRTSSRGAQGIRADFNEENGTLELSGAVRRGGVEVALLPIPHPLQYVGQLLRNSILAEGIRLKGQTLIQTTPQAAGEGPALVQRMGTHESPPLVQMLYLMMKQSNNFLAEQLWRAASARAMGCGDLPRARQAELAWFHRHGLNWIEPGWDGSGLSRKNQIAPRDLTAINRALYNTAYQGILLKVLPTAGASGTLRHRTTSIMDGRVTAKTGTLAGVSSLSGFITDTRGRPRLVFSVIGNAPRDTNGRLAKRINDLMTIAIRKLDEEIAAGHRPVAGPPPPAGTEDFDFDLSFRTLAAGSGDFFGAEAETMDAEKEQVGTDTTVTTTSAVLSLPPAMASLAATSLTLAAGGSVSSR